VRALIASVAVAAWLACAGVATAHVEVLPTSVPAGEAVEFTVRVPTERDLPTSRLSVEFPPQVTVFSFAEPPPGWRITPLRRPDGRFRGVVYSGGSIPPARYADFRMLGTPFEEGTAVWASRQMYADGQVKAWTGPPEPPGAESTESGPDQPGPAAAVEITAPGTASGEAPAAAGDEDDGSGAAIWLGVIAIGISLLAALAVGFLWSTRPARLPEDER
jgi:Domain of unkown function (DUF1775)